MPQYVTKEIALLDEHDLLDDDGNVVFSIDENVLEQIADNNNRRVEETGDETPVVIGHTKDGQPEEQQPEIVGWARDFRVKQLFKTGRKAIFATVKFLKDKLDLVQHFPRRSVELWLRKKIIDPISLLGATTPERDLGLLRFASGEPTYNPLSPEEAMPHMPQETDAVVQAVLSALQQTDVWKFVEQLMNEAQGAAEPPADDVPADDVPPADVPTDDEAPADDDVPLDDEEEPQRYEAGAPSGSNTFLPGGTGRRPKPKARPRPAPAGDASRLKMQRDQLRGQLARFQAAHRKTEQELKALRLKFQRAEREKDLIQLESEGYMFDRAEELDLLAALPQKEYERRLDLIRKRYQRAPLGVHDFRTATREPDRGRTRERAQEVASYAAEKGMSYEEALAELEGQKVF